MKKSIREGGAVEQWITERGRRSMELAAANLGRGGAGKGDGRSPQPLHAGGWATAAPSKMGDGGKAKPLELHMVVGTMFWYMAVFALASLKRHLDRELAVYFYSDGTLTKEQAEALSRLPIQAIFIKEQDISHRVETGLPKEKYPHLRERFQNYPNIRKLISPHIGSYGPKIVLDADVLFYRKPEELMEWQDSSEKILCATDCKESYGYPREELDRLAGGRLPPRVNVGITGLVSEKIKWDELEQWCAELHQKYGTHYYLEQALIAMMCVKAGYRQLDKDRYITGPSKAQAHSDAGVMQHYVDLSKKWYFRNNWQTAIRSEGKDPNESLQKGESIDWFERLLPQRRLLPRAFGTVKTYLYRKPKDEIRRMAGWGLQGYFRTPAWAKEMERAAEQLRPPTAVQNKPVREVWFLSGRTHWYQTAFCAWTFQRWSRFRVVPVIVDDGTFDAEVQGRFAKVFPEHRLMAREDCNRRFTQEFPVSRYPMIHALRDRQVLFRKLTKVFGRADEWRFLMDSDMLFFSEPKEIDELLETRDTIFTQKDCQESYGYPKGLLERLAGAKLPEAINIGIVQYNGARTDWDRVEAWLLEIIAKEGIAYNVTQATFAMILAQQKIQHLDAVKYKVYPKNPRPEDPLPVCGHYVADSKPWYFGKGWRKAIK